MYTNPRNGGAKSLATGESPSERSPQGETLVQSLQRARHHADIGGRLPEAARLGGAMRLLARFVARVILSCSRFLVKPQRQFNRAALASLNHLGAELGEVSEQLRAHARQIETLQETVRLQEHLLHRLLGEAGARQPVFSAGDRDMIGGDGGHSLDALYVALEDRFRGTQEEIRERLRTHLPLVFDAGLGTETFPVLDLGCGRGEWLEVLRAEGLSACGVDGNRDMVADCLRKGLEVCEGDVVAHLRDLPGASVGLVTGFHLIEHLPLPELVELIDETVRVLKPGGAALFETPNPQNVLVGSWTFYLDPTHRNPLPSALSKFLLEARGLARVEVRDLHPFPESHRLAGAGIAERFNELFCGPRDYAVVGWKV